MERKILNEINQYMYIKTRFFYYVKVYKTVVVHFQNKKKKNLEEKLTREIGILRDFSNTCKVRVKPKSSPSFSGIPQASVKQLN